MKTYDQKKFNRLLEDAQRLGLAARLLKDEIDVFVRDMHEAVNGNIKGGDRK